MRYFCVFSGGHFEFWNFFRWLTGFIKRAISKGYVCQFWCLFPEMRYFCVFGGGHFEFWNFFRWLTGFIKRAISKEYVCQFWCLFPEMKDSYDILLLSAPLNEAKWIYHRSKDF